MKSGLRAAFGVALLLAAVMSAGCQEVFYFSFADEGAIYNDKYAFLAEIG